MSDAAASQAGWTIRNFRISQDEEPAAGGGDVVQLYDIGGDGLTLEIARSSRRDDGKHSRSIRIGLDRSQALGLGRQLINAAAGLIDLDGADGECRSDLSADNSTPNIPCKVSLSAIQVPGVAQAIVILDRQEIKAGRLYRESGCGAFGLDDLAAFARSLLIMGRN